MQTFNDNKAVFLGSSAAGKTSLIERYCKSQFNDYQEPTIGAAFNCTTIPTTPQPTRVGIWDTAGQERYDSLCPMYYRGASAAIIVFDVTECSSFAKANHWLQTLKENETKAGLILVGTKIDLEEKRKIDYQRAHSLAQEYDAGYYECSAVTNIGIDLLFRRIGNICRAQQSVNMELQHKLMNPKPERDWCNLHFGKCC